MVESLTWKTDWWPTFRQKEKGMNLKGKTKKNLADENLPRIPNPALGIDLDGTVDEAPDFFKLLSSMWPGPVFIITYRDNKSKAEADAARFGVNAEVVLVNSFAEKAEVIRRLNIRVFFDDMDEVLLHIPKDVSVFKVRNEGNFCFETKKWLYSTVTGRQL